MPNDGPASDSMSFEQFLMRKGRGDLIPDKPVKRSKGSPKGGEVAKKTVKKKKARGCGIAKKGTRKAKIY